MKFLMLLFSVVFLVGLTHSVEAQTSLTALRAQLTGSNNPVQPSYEKELVDFQKSETERALSQGLLKRKLAQEKLLKESLQQEKMVRLEQEQQDLLQRKEDLEQEELQSELKQQLVISYIRKLQQESSAKSKGNKAIQNSDDSVEKAPDEAAPALTPKQQTNSVQEAMKPESAKYTIY